MRKISFSRKFDVYKKKNFDTLRVTKRILKHRKIHNANATEG